MTGPDRGTRRIRGGKSDHNAGLAIVESRMSNMRRVMRGIARLGVSWLPRGPRYALYRDRIKCDFSPSEKLVLKLAETREELEACFKLLHDAYVAVDFMKPDPSGMRITFYHALPTTSTLLASHNGRVVGTVSLIRESLAGFPMQRIFNIDAIRDAGGNIAEVSALAIDRRFQAKGGIILFPLMKFMYEYATKLFDTRHLVIAVNPRHIQFYESILFFRRLKQNPVPHYDFVNGAPAVGAHLDLKRAPKIFKMYYNRKALEKNLYRYFTDLRLPNIVFPDKRFYTTNDPVMTPELIDYFFNQRTPVFARLAPGDKLRLHLIYDLPAYVKYLPPLPADVVLKEREMHRRRHRRFSVNCPGVLVLDRGPLGKRFAMKIIECSMLAFRASSDDTLPLDASGHVTIDLGEHEHCRMRARVVRKVTSAEHTFVLSLDRPDLAWRKFVKALHKASTHEELEEASRFLE